MVFRKNLKYNRGFTYAELIVVLSIFTMVSSVIAFDYKKFQAKVDIKNLASDIALKVVETQKLATSGKWNSLAGSTWRPSYGIYFDLSAGANTGNKIFYYFADLNQNKYFDYGAYSCPSSECLDKYTISKGNYISSMTVYYTNGTSTSVSNDLHISFTRPDSGATINSNGTALSSGISYAEIIVLSPKGDVTGKVKVYASGRIQIN